MSRLRFPWKPIPDDEYIDRLRSSMRFWNRWRYFFLVANIGAVIAIVYLAERGLRFLMDMALPPGNAPVNWPLAGFVCGAMLGMAMGWFFWHSLHQLIESIDGMQSQRLLLKYYDAYDALRTGEVASDDGGGEFIDSRDGAGSLPEV
jgi:hypothetical protein